MAYISSFSPAPDIEAVTALMESRYGRDTSAEVQRAAAIAAYERPMEKLKRRGAAFVGLAAGAYATYKCADGLMEASKFFLVPDGVCPSNTDTYYDAASRACEYYPGHGPTTFGIVKTALAACVTVGSMFYVDEKLGKHPDI